MGYRSDVTAVFYSTDVDGNFTRTGAEVEAELRENFPQVFELWPDGHWKACDDYLLFTAKGIEWYSPLRHDIFTPDELRALGALDELFEDADGVDYELVRIEDGDDGGHESSSWGVRCMRGKNVLRVQREVTVQFDVPMKREAKED